MKQGWYKRLPLLLAALGALFFWRGGLGLVPVEREITWHLWGKTADIREVEVQLYDGDALLKREVFKLPRGPFGELTSKVPLKSGSYLGRVMIWRQEAGQPEVKNHTLTVDDSGEKFSLP